MVPAATTPRIVRRGSRAHSPRRISERALYSAARGLGIRLSGLLPLDPRTAVPPLVLDPAHLLPRLLPDPLRVTARPVARRPPRGVTPDDFRDHGHVLPLLCILPVLPGRWTALRRRHSAQCRNGGVAGACCCMAHRSR